MMTKTQGRGRKSEHNMVSEVRFLQNMLNTEAHVKPVRIMLQDNLVEMVPLIRITCKLSP